jgi:hypothetical protein
MTLGRFVLAADHMNDRFFFGTAAHEFTLLQQYTCCERMQHNLNRSGMGSLPTFAAAAHEINAKSESERRHCGLSRPPL